MHSQGYSLLWLILGPSSTLLTMCRSLFSWANPKFTQFVQRKKFSKLFDPLQAAQIWYCAAPDEAGTWWQVTTQINSKHEWKTRDSGAIKMLGFHTKALKSSHVQTLGATSACDPAVCGFLNRLQISTQHFNITASSAKLRETRDSNIFSLCFFFFFLRQQITSQLKSLRWQKATAKQSYQRIPPARQQQHVTQSTWPHAL